uniref:helix-turn-helix domain-containing protein n=1 Tax=unclassified Streptomyces TaxID=2593676 RepID=UPI003F4978A5
MTEPTSPTVHRRQLGKQLRLLRTAAGLDLSDAAAALGCHQARISRIETGKGGAVAKKDDVIKLCQRYGVDDDGTVQKLLTLLTNSQKPGWWEGLGLPPALDIYIGLETDARSERAWEPLLVHGALQTPDYARAVLAAPKTHRSDDIEDGIQLREGRYRLLTRPTAPLELWVILDENTLLRPVGGADVMRGQLRHLRDSAELPNVTVQVFPLRKEAHPGLGGAFSLLEFEEDPPVAYVDSPGGNLYLEKARDVRGFGRTFDLLRASALDPDESAVRIERAIEEI